MALDLAPRARGVVWTLFEPRMMNGARERVELQQDLRGALARGQLEPCYQPKIHAPSGEITGAEALLRWHHPQRGLIGPSVFIPIAERFGLIGAMGNWGHRRSLSPDSRLARPGLADAGRRQPIGAAVGQPRSGRAHLRFAAAAPGQSASADLEVTESEAMEDADGAIATFEKLAAAGVYISIDDFGTGYWSLSYLRKLRAVELKIDRNFVLDLETSSDARAVVDAVVKLAQALGPKVIAEGVETEEQHPQGSSPGPLH